MENAGRSNIHLDETGKKVVNKEVVWRSEETTVSYRKRDIAREPETTKYNSAKILIKKDLHSSELTQWSTDRKCKVV